MYVNGDKQIAAGTTAMYAIDHKKVYNSYDNIFIKLQYITM